MLARAVQMRQKCPTFTTQDERCELSGIDHCADDKHGKDDHLLIVLLLYGFDLEGASPCSIRPSRPTWGLTTNGSCSTLGAIPHLLAGDELK